GLKGVEPMIRAWGVLCAGLCLLAAGSVRAEERPIVRTYQVGDIVTADPLKKDVGDELVQKILKTIGPGPSWAVNGGEGRVEYHPLGTALVIKQTREVHMRIAELLADLRKWQKQAAGAKSDDTR